MQLNYSRAFGGKDLKMYGLSAVPSISRVDLRPRKSGNNDNKSNDGNNDDEDVCLLLGSDGLWDVINPNQGVYVAMKVQRDYAQAQHQLVQRGHPTNVVPDMLNASQALVSMALRNHQKMGSNDNVTCIAIFL